MGNIGSAFKVGKREYQSKVDNKYQELIYEYRQWLTKPVNDSCKPTRWQDCSNHLSFYQLHKKHGGRRDAIYSDLRDYAITTIQSQQRGEKVATNYFTFMLGGLFKVIEYFIAVMLGSLFPAASVIIQLIMAQISGQVLEKLNGDVMANLYSQADISKLPIFPVFKDRMRELIDYLKTNQMELVLYQK